MTKVWQIVGKIKNQKSKIKTDEIVEILLKNRGVEAKKEKEEFFKPIPPEKIRLGQLKISKLEVSKAIKRIKKARENKEKVIVYGDYDADGICGTAILWETLYSLGLNVLPYIPERFTEGYGLNEESIRKLKSEDPELKLIITVDHGIVASKKVDLAKDLGIDVIITDHHQPEKVKPRPLALIHTTKISGSGVAWVFSREIAKAFSNKLSAISYQLELVAIGTIADQLPLIGPNRSFAKYGLEALNNTKRLGLIELMKVAGIEIGLTQRSVYEVGFLIAPRLNAMGRLEHAMESLRLLCTKSPARADELARHLNRVNQERQRIVEEVVIQTKKSAIANKDGVIILADESYHEGVIGLAAGKLVEEYYRPAIVLSKKGKISKASARSISGFNIIEAIRKLEHLYIEGGGHPMAAGFSIETAKIKEFTREINKIANPLLTQEVLTQKLKVDVNVSFKDLTEGLFEKIQDFEPSGLGNPTPTFTTEGLEILDSRTVGRDGSHLKLKLRQNNIEFGAIGFGFGYILKDLFPDKKVDIVYSLAEDSWNVNKRLQLKLKDVKLE